MARKPRIHIDNAFYHVMLRGNNRQAIFFSDEDRNFFYSLIDEGIKRYDHQIHAFCLMNNHVHLLLQVGNTTLSKVMQNLSFRYARWVNLNQKRVGHLFQGRFKAKLVETDQYLIKLIEYIHLNPVEAGVVTNIDEYRWCSHRNYLGKEDCAWLTTNYMLSLFGSCIKTAKVNYRDFINKSDARPFVRINTINLIEFKQKNFKTDYNEYKSALNFQMVAAHVCCLYNISESNLQGDCKSHLNAKVRAIIAWIIRELKIDTLTKVAAYFNRDVTGIIRTIRRLECNESCSMEMTNVLKQLIKATSQA